MINEINNIDPIKSAFTSLISVSVGTISNLIPTVFVGYFSLETVNMLFQHAAWTVAIIAGFVSIINGVRNWKIFKKRVK